ncbi:MAG: TaqI-like C-terminal specificity domain-containing protein [Bacteroidales bacterium]|nr:TaqI-like C-terminal specificity domain-containing protein [Bacteroidales bacterium]
MHIKALKPRKALNKAFLKVKPNRTDIEQFKANLIQLLNRTNDTESEEFHKNLVSDFLKDTYYKQNHFINTKGRNDLVIHTGPQATSAVGVIIEAKKPTNKSEMLKAFAEGDTDQQMLAKLNVKAFQELVLYDLRERITHKNLEVKYLIATNINEWFIFDATLFDRLFAQNKNLVKQFSDFEDGRLSETKTDFFYKQIAEPFIAAIKTEIEFTYFNFQDYRKPLLNVDKTDDNKLIALFKLLSPEHLLKLPFVNDSNSLDKRFYLELLHIIGLNETKEGGKKLIERNKSGERHTASILEDAIIQLDSLDKLSRIDKPAQFGNTTQERLFNVALELSITWINRILFLKLLEAQLITYHKGDKSYAFLNLEKIKNYDDLNSLFFQVLARKHEQRNEDVLKAFEKVPYLNSSLFEPTEIEQLTIFISNLKDDKSIPVFSQTVLKDQHGKKRAGHLSTLEYIFAFLNAYDFSSEGSEEIQEDNKTLINASVLGLIFEKINGYKDGSFFTPGFITMYMCRETIRKAVVQKFNETKKWDCTSIDDLYDKIENRKEANDIVNSIKICDPAVGSGHFLVSALNEMIAVKNDLRILQDRDNKRLKEYHVEVVNDELIVTDEEGELFEYNHNNRESQRIQETLFHEKQSIIENCLFGVDINPNSVKICRLRLWIELLKNAYYKNKTELETLPNIDINIKCGNSLVSRFAIDADLKQALKKSKWSIDSYRMAVDTYRNAENKEQKREMERLIAGIKSEFRSEISLNDLKVKKLKRLSGELFQLTNQQQLFEMSKKENAVWNAKVENLTKETRKLEAEIEEIKANKIFENAFEWRFEFPEVLNDDGDFVGFDVVIGNPPYIRQEEFSGIKLYLQGQFNVFAGTADLYVYFVELAMRLLRNEGNFIFIIPNKWMRANYGKNLRNFVKKYQIERILDFGDLPVFEEATTYPSIIQLKKATAKEQFVATNIQTLDFPAGLSAYNDENIMNILVEELQPEGWTLTNSNIQKLLGKIRSKGIPLIEYIDGKIFYGLKTGLNEAFVIDRPTRNRLVAEDPRSIEIIKPFLAGRDIKRYQSPQNDKYLILFPKGFTIKRNLPENDPNYINFVNEPPRYGYMNFEIAWEWVKTNYPAISKHLAPFKKPAEKRSDQGDFWWELRACDYYIEFEKPKIMLPDISKKAECIMDFSGCYCVNTAYIIPKNDKYLLALMNSKTVHFYYSNLTSTIRGGYLRFIRQYMEQIPIANGESLNKDIIENLVNQVQSTKNQNPSADTTDLEHQIDQLVYQLYDLTEEEIKIVEGTN